MQGKVQVFIQGLYAVRGLYPGDIDTVDDFARPGEADLVTRELQSQFGERVRSLREASGRSQEVFAAQANIDRSTYGKLERGEINPSLVTMARVAVALEVTIATLLEGLALDAKQIQEMPRITRGPRPAGGRYNRK